MNKIKILLAAAAVAFCALQSPAEAGYKVYATPGTAINAGTNYAIIPSQSFSGGEPLVTYINYNALFASGSSTLTAYVSTNQTTELLTNSTTTLYVNSTNGFAPNQWVVIQHTWMNLPRFQNEAAIISAVQNTNQIVLFTAPVNTVLPNDVVNQETPWSTIAASTSTTAAQINGPGITSGQRNEPFLFTLVGSATGTNAINTINAVFQ